MQAHPLTLGLVPSVFGHSVREVTTFKVRERRRNVGNIFVKYSNGSWSVDKGRGGEG